MNPLLPENCFVPDAEARGMPDGRLYLYGSWDLSNRSEYCSHELHCFSTDDLEHWTDHGVIFRNDEVFYGIPWRKETMLYAPDAIERNGKYYLYVCGSNKEEGVAVADSPVGPFSEAQPIQIADGDSIDPTVFLDDDGQGYLFWGQFSLRGARLSDDMKTILPESVHDGILTEWEHGFHEGASIRKRGDKYYMVYTDISRGKATCLAYAIADHPFGPYQKGGVIVDNVYCDPNSWNNHGSIAEFKGQWYVFYHRSSQGQNTCRRVCAEPIQFDEHGFIREVEQTSQGVSSPLNALQPIRARSACRMLGKCRIEAADDHEILVAKQGKHWGISDWAEYKYVDFGKNGIKRLRVLAKGRGRITVKIDGNQEISRIEINSDELMWHTEICESVCGIHPLWLFFDGDLFIEEFLFK